MEGSRLRIRVGMLCFGGSLGLLVWRLRRPRIYGADLPDEGRGSAAAGMAMAGVLAWGEPPPERSGTGNGREITNEEARVAEDDRVDIDATGPEELAQ